QTVQGRQTQGYANNEVRNTATNQGVNRQGAASQVRVVKCYNCQEEDNGDTVIPAQASQEIPTSATFQTDDLDAFDSDCDDVPITKAILMANLSFYDLDVFLRETKTLIVQSTKAPVQQDELLMSVIEEMLMTSNNVTFIASFIPCK
ncbi:hypothetical protein Tco_1387519, partial [Tanacetum coccineum]